MGKRVSLLYLKSLFKTFSIYLRNGELQSEHNFVHTDEEDFEVRAFIETVLSDERVELPQAIVIDVGVISGRGWAVVEQNAAWGRFVWLRSYLGFISATLYCN